MQYSSFMHDEALMQWANVLCSSLECCDRLQGDRTLQEARMATERSVLWQPEWGIFWSVFTEAPARRVELGCRVRLKETITWCAGKVRAGRTGTVRAYRGSLAQIVWDRQRSFRGTFVFGVPLGEVPDWLEVL